MGVYNSVLPFPPICVRLQIYVSRVSFGTVLGGKVSSSAMAKQPSSFSHHSTSSEDTRHLGRKRAYRKKLAKGEALPAYQATYSSLQAIFPTVAKQIGFEKQLAELALLAAWSTIVGHPLNTVTKAVKIQHKGSQRRLLLAVQNPSLATELSFQLPQLLAKLNALSPQTGIVLTGIDVTVGGKWS